MQERKKRKMEETHNSNNKVQKQSISKLNASIKYIEVESLERSHPASIDFEYNK